jgi:signal peptidase I
MRTALNWLAFVAVLAGFWTIAGPTALGGPASYVIVDGTSMEPTYRHGDLVVAREREVYDVGDIITYDAPVDGQFNVIHRVVGTSEEGYITQGENMERPDGWLAPSNSVYGASWFRIPAGGRILVFLRQPASILGLAAGFIAFEILKRHELVASETREPSEVAA